MSEDIVDVDWVATWSCPKCKSSCDDVDYDVDYGNSVNAIKCKELVDKGGEDLEVCEHEYFIRR